MPTTDETQRALRVTRIDYSVDNDVPTSEELRKFLEGFVSPQAKGEQGDLIVSHIDLLYSQLKTHHLKAGRLQRHTTEPEHALLEILDQDNIVVARAFLEFLAQ